MKALHVQNLTKQFGDLTAVNGVNFFVEYGEIFGFLGPNGAGKTTTINMLIGLARMTAGTISVMGHSYPDALKMAQREIGVVPDESNLYDEMSGLENLTFCASLYGIPRKDSEPRALDLLHQFDLHDVKDKAFKAYSKGMKRKLTIAAALIHKPSLLFLDEPTSGIDVASARQIRHELKELNQNGTTIFLTTHYIEEAERLCDRIAFIVAGDIVRTGTVTELMQYHESEQSVEFTLDQPLGDLSSIQEAFPQTAIEKAGERSLRIRSVQSVDLLPFMRYFDHVGLQIYEARILRPSLEDVFVNVTGIEAEKMKNNQRGAHR